MIACPRAVHTRVLSDSSLVYQVFKNIRQGEGGDETEIAFIGFGRRIVGILLGYRKEVLFGQRFQHLLQFGISRGGICNAAGIAEGKEDVGRMHIFLAALESFAGEPVDGFGIVDVIFDDLYAQVLHFGPDLRKGIITSRKSFADLKT